jgi:hypothetical protein
MPRNLENATEMQWGIEQNIGERGMVGVFFQSGTELAALSEGYVDTPGYAWGYKCQTPLGFVFNSTLSLRFQHLFFDTSWMPD